MHPPVTRPEAWGLGITEAAAHLLEGLQWAASVEKPFRQFPELKVETPQDPEI